MDVRLRSRELTQNAPDLWWSMSDVQQNRELQQRRRMLGLSDLDSDPASEHAGQFRPPSPDGLIDLDWDTASEHDGEFHPPSPDGVMSALGGVRFPDQDPEGDGGGGGVLAC